MHRWKSCFYNIDHLWLVWRANFLQDSWVRSSCLVRVELQLSTHWYDVWFKFDELQGKVITWAVLQRGCFCHIPFSAIWVENVEVAAAEVATRCFEARPRVEKILTCNFWAYYLATLVNVTVLTSTCPMVHVKARATHNHSGKYKW